MEVDGLGVTLIPELIDGTAEFVVSIVAAGIENIVARVVGQDLCRCIDARSSWAVVLPTVLTMKPSYA